MSVLRMTNEIIHYVVPIMNFVLHVLRSRQGTQYLQNYYISKINENIQVLPDCLPDYNFVPDVSDVQKQPKLKLKLKTNMAIIKF